MWCLGVVVYMMVSGGLEPFWRGNQVQTQRRTIRAQYSFSDQAFQRVSDLAKQFIEGLLQLQPNKRMTALTAMRHMWMRTEPATSPKVSQGIP